MERESRHVREGASKPTPQEEAADTRRELDGFVRRTHEFLADVGDAETRRAGRMRDFTDAERRAYAEAVEDIDPPLAERYAAVESLMGAAIAILHDGVPEGAKFLDDDPRYLQEHVASAINAYGLTVVKTETNRHQSRRSFRQLRRLRTVYASTEGDRASDDPPPDTRPRSPRTHPNDPR